MLNNPYAYESFLNNPSQSSLISPISYQSNPYFTKTLGLSQIQGFVPIKDFTDANNTKWQLVKSSDDSTVDVPDPKSLQITDYWNHEFPNIKSKIYVYVVEGIRQPKVETEQPTKVMFQWFSTLWVPTFTPQMITEKEWLKANVYAANYIDTRTSKLNAICKISMPTDSEDEDKLIKVDELNERNTERD